MDRYQVYQQRRNKNYVRKSLRPDGRMKIWIYILLTSIVQVGTKFQIDKKT